jgi:hypothetical protein
LRNFISQENKGRLRLSRRDLLRGLAGSVAVSGLARFAGAFPDLAYPFEQISPSVSGITWVHTNGKSPERFLPETTGAGCAFLDYDNDGWMDIYLVNSGKCDFFTPDPPLRNALYRNNHDGTFTDVTGKAGVAAGGYGQGVAVADYDGDGFPDLYVTQYGRSILYHNNGDGTFTDVTEKAGVAAPGWASSAVWFDYDNDGRLDLFVCQFVEFSKSLNKTCGLGEEGKHGYCIPRLYQPMPSWLFRNNGDGTFTDVSKASGIGKFLGKAWGVVATDINKGSSKRSALQPEWRSARTAGPAPGWASTPRTTIRTVGWISSSPISIAKSIPSIRTITTKLLTIEPGRPESAWPPG